MMTWKARFRFRVLRLFVFSCRNMVAQGIMVTGLTTPFPLTLIFILCYKEPECPHVDDPAHKPKLHSYFLLILWTPSGPIGMVTLAMWSTLRTTELGKMLTFAMDVSLGLFRQGTQVPRYPEYGPETEWRVQAPGCLLPWPHRLLALGYLHPCPSMGLWICVLNPPFVLLAKHLNTKIQLICGKIHTCLTFQSCSDDQFIYYVRQHILNPPALYSLMGLLSFISASLAVAPRNGLWWDLLMPWYSLQR